MDRHQHAILKTSENALQAKAAAVREGYYDDPYIAAFCESQQPLGSASRTSRRPPHVQPIIKRGTHARVCCMDRVIQKFAKLCLQQHGTTMQDEDCLLQIVVLGCGKDTLFFRHSEDLTRHPSVVLKWFEVDHEPTISEKVAIIASHVSSVFDDATITKLVQESGYEIETTPGATCTLLAHDLRHDGLVELLQGAGCDPSLPTLFLFECVLMYVPQDSSHQLLESIATTYRQACLCMYEPILGNDPFGRVMEANLARVGLATEGASLLETRHLGAQLDRCLATGWVTATGCDLWMAYDSVLTAAQRQRANRAEPLDEWEEFVLISQHYCLIVATVAVGATGDKAKGGVAIGQALVEISPTSILGFSPGKAESRSSLS
jgi:O-methyltransferase involved in polyketide biosynthesis